MSRNKSYVVQIFGQDGVTGVETLDLTKLKNKLTYVEKINGGLGELTLDLAYPFDSFGEGTRVKAMNIVDLYVVEASNPLGRRVYRGFMSQYEPYVLQNGATGVQVRCLGLVSLLERSYYKNGSNYSVTHTTADPETIGRAIIDHFNTIYGGSLLSYSAASTDPTGTTVSKTFTDKKWFEALKETGEVALEGWWWKVDADGLYWLKAKPATATHMFTIGRDINWLRAPKDSEDVINDVQVRGGSTVDDSDATSQAEFGTGSPATGKMSAIISDSGLSSPAVRAAKEIDDKKSMVIKATLQINDTYDIESVKVGHTCQVLNKDLSNTFFSTNMMIVQITWEGETATLQLGDYRGDVAVEIGKMVA